MALQFANEYEKGRIFAPFWNRLGLDKKMKERYNGFNSERNIVPKRCDYYQQSKLVIFDSVLYIPSPQFELLSAIPFKLLHKINNKTYGVLNYKGNTFILLLFSCLKTSIQTYMYILTIFFL